MEQVISVEKYILGNGLRGCFEGEFASPDEAWRILSARFDRSFPGGGRSILMWIREENRHGFTENSLRRKGETDPSITATDAELDRCRHSDFRG